jgi:hypothetical protein
MTGKPSDGMSAQEWMAQNPKRDDETRDQYRARYNQRGR